jgi:hypothetical protein
MLLALSIGLPPSYTVLSNKQRAQSAFCLRQSGTVFLWCAVFRALRGTTAHRRLARSMLPQANTALNAGDYAAGVI